MKKFTLENPPEFLKGFPAEVLKIGVDIYNSIFTRGGNEKRAQMAAMAGINARFEKSGESWIEKKKISGFERSESIRFRAAQAKDSFGLKWEVVLIEPGLSLGYPRFYWSDEVLEESTPLFSGVDINAYELTADYFSHLTVPESVALEDVNRNGME